MRTVWSAPDLRQRLLRRRVPLLGYTAGAIYRDVVLACLDRTFEQDVEDDGIILEQFEMLAVEPLRKLKA